MRKTDPSSTWTMARLRARPRSRAARTCRRVSRSSRTIWLVWHRVAGLEHVGVAEAVVLEVATIGDLERPGGEPAKEGDRLPRGSVPDQLRLRVLRAHRPDRRVGRRVGR